MSAALLSGCIRSLFLVLGLAVEIPPEEPEYDIKIERLVPLELGMTLAAESVVLSATISRAKLPR
ncbi:MAG: hypothetical protein ACR2NM_00735 [Bythopirellula sp.]